MKVARFLDVGQIEIKDEEKPAPKEHEILFQVKNSGICGTDLHIYKGEVKGLVKKGTVLGHEFCGIVESVGSAVKSFKPGDKIAVEPNLYCGACHYCRNAKKHFCQNWAAVGLSRDGGFQEYCIIPESAAYPMPKNLSFKNGAFFEPMACVLHGIERAKVKPGECVIVQGAGSIGQLYVQALKRIGSTKIIVSDIDPSKLSLATKFGADIAINPQKEILQDVIMAETNGIGAQVLIDAAGLINTIPNSIPLLENTGRIVIFGVPEEGKRVEIMPYDIYRREIEIIGSFTNPYTNEAALELLAKVDVDPIITNPIKIEDLVEKGLKMMGKPGVLKVQIQF